ncbi:hypothetical protein ACFQY7_40935 [Actinomadura luteofluorescens]|uniref:hypothetical protein n=1 Tax=Actinomadura luteofluorescens TaxID=46163 RepID=UPI003635B462
MTRPSDDKDTAASGLSRRRLLRVGAGVALGAGAVGAGWVGFSQDGRQARVMTAAGRATRPARPSRPR